MDEGQDVMPIHGVGARMIVGHQMRYPLENGFPLMTERDLTNLFPGALGEHIGFLNGARTLDQLEQYGCPPAFWKRWVTKEKCDIFNLPEGDLGDGSYGAAWATFPTAEGAPFNQIAHVVQQIKERPYLRTHIISPWIPQYTIQHDGLTRRVVVAPCHGWIHILAFPDTKELVIHHFQRSADVPVGVAFNIIQYAAFGMMLGQILGYRMKELVHTFSDAHIYHNQFDAVNEMLAREPKPFPTVTLDPSIDDIFAFRPSHFTLSDYESHPKMVIPTPV
ncbi:MAG: Thymidylate synthase [Parcubacteria group bacterium]|nr:Thymidylate synthase [Parcubacteria group bacterium]